ncbi:MAG: hypothetical protein KTR16_06570, partial [Acidiferrobacterales bacterium]|nr:hypothetical protein [Acidiferrobacterales bacterium]
MEAQGDLHQANKNPTAGLATEKAAGFWVRILSYIIDSLCLIVITYVASLAFGLPTFVDFLNATD